jgi:hypothetical protein
MSSTTTKGKSRRQQARSTVHLQPEQVQQIVSTQQSTKMRTEVYEWGKGRQIFEQPRLLMGKRVTRISCGGDHAAALTGTSCSNAKQIHLIQQNKLLLDVLID